MKKLIYSVILLFTISSSTAQEYTYQILDPGNNTFFDEVIPVQNGFLSFNVSANQKVQVVPLGANNLRMGAEVLKLDKDMKPGTSFALFNGEKKLLPGLISFFKFGSHVCVLYQDAINKELGNLKMMTIDESTLQVIKDITVIDFEKNKISYDLKRLVQGKAHSFKYMISPNHKRLVVYTEPEGDKGDNKIIFLTLFDENLKVLTEKKVDMKLQADNIYIRATTMDNSGNFYIAYKEYPDGDKKGYVKVNGHKMGSFENRLLVIKAEGKDMFADIVKLEGYSAGDMGMAFSPKHNKVYILGSYSIGLEDNIIGTYKSEIDAATLKIGKPTTAEFPDDILEALDKDGFAKGSGKNKGLKIYYTAYPIVRGDGTVDILMRYGLLKHQTSGTGRSSSTFYEGSFLDCHFIDDKIIYSRIPRDMSSLTAGSYVGYYPYSPDERLFLFYNESEKNIERDMADAPKTAVVQNTEICVASISKTGVVKREAALKGNSLKSIGIVSSSFSVYPNTVYVFLQRLSGMGMSTRDTKFAKISIK